MDIRTFRAKTMQQALNLVRSELGPEATVLHTRELNSSLVGRFLRGREYEIAASLDVAPAKTATVPNEPAPPRAVSRMAQPPVEIENRAQFRADSPFSQQPDAPQSFSGLHALAQQLRERTAEPSHDHLSESLFQVYTDMIECDIEERLARELIDRLRSESDVDASSAARLRADLTQLIADEQSVTGPISAGAGQGKVVALVGPTGVGKTTTIAKLAANYRLRENKRVGLITVDTYRIAAVEQLRTYADIIDLPMEIVSTPREMREAIARMSDLDLILMDTAGRSPRDEVKIQELKSMLAEAEPDEVHLVLSAVSGARTLVSTAERFATVGTTALLVTKLDEATALGNLLSVTRQCDLPIGYLTDGQNVPDDIQVAEAEKLAGMILSGT